MYVGFVGFRVLRCLGLLLAADFAQHRATRIRGPRAITPLQAGTDFSKLPHPGLSHAGLGYLGLSSRGGNPKTRAPIPGVAPRALLEYGWLAKQLKPPQNQAHFGFPSFGARPRKPHIGAVLSQPCPSACKRTVMSYRSPVP